MGAVSLQGGPPGRFCGLTAQGYLGRKGGLAVKSWVVGVVWGLMAQGPLPSLELGGELLAGWLFAALWFWGTRETLTTLHAPSRQLVPLLLGAGPRKATTPTIPGPGRIREMHLLVPSAQEQRPVPSSQPSLFPMSFHPSSFDRSHRCFCKAAGLCHHPSGDEGHGALVCSARLCRKGLITN